MIGFLSFPAVLVKSLANFIIRIASDFSIREIYHANGLGVNCGLLELLECWKQQLSGFQHFNDFNDSQEGNAVQDSPFYSPSRRSAILS